MKRYIVLTAATVVTSTLCAAETCLPANAPAKPDVWGMILVYLAPVLFILILVALFRWAKRDKLSLKDLLVERNLPDNHPATAEGAATMAANGQQSDTTATAPPSSSRLVMLLSGLAAVVVGVVLCSYNIYSLLHFGCIPESASFTSAILALGIGVTPYATKQVFK